MKHSHSLARAAAVLVLALLTSATAWAQNPAVSYIDENGVTQTTTDYYALTGSETPDGNGRVVLSQDVVVVNSNVTYDQKGLNLNSTGNEIKLILCDGKTLTINSISSDFRQVVVNKNLTIYGQTNNTGKLVVNATNQTAIDASNCTITVNGGTVESISTHGSGLGLLCSALVFNGGNLKLEGNVGVQCKRNTAQTVTLNWRSASDRVFIRSFDPYNNTVKTVNIGGAGGKCFTDGNGNYYGGTYTSGFSAFAGKELQPATAYTLTLPDGVSTSTTAAFTYSGVDYYGPGTTVTLSDLPTDDPGAGYRYAYIYGGNAISGTTLTMPDANVTLNVAIVPIDWATVNAGTEGDPYMIYNKDQLQLLAHRVNGTHGETANTYSGKYFKLGADIKFTYGPNEGDEYAENYEAIGHLGQYSGFFFKGKFDGDDKTVSGIRLRNANSCQALFGLIGDGADIHDVHVTDARIKGYENVGGIVGKDQGGIVSNCTVTESAITASNNYGTICGWGRATLSHNYYRHCTVNGTAVTSGKGSREGDVTANSGAVPLYLVTPATGVTIQTAMADDLGFSYDSDNDGTPEDYWRAGAELTLATTGIATPAQGYRYAYIYGGNTISGTTLTVNQDATVSAVIRSDGQTHSVAYMKADGTTDDAQAIALDETMTTLSSGWYFVGKDINYTQTVTLEDDVTLILCNGKTMTVGTSESGISSGRGISGSSALTVYGQTLDDDAAGHLNIYMASGNQGINISPGAYTQHSGNVSVTTVGLADIGISAKGVTLRGGTLNVSVDNSHAICSNADIDILGGKLDATVGSSDRYGLSATGSITLGYTNASDFITFNSLTTTTNGFVKISDGKAMTDGTNTYNDQTESSTLAALTNKTLRPVTYTVSFNITNDDNDPASQTILHGSKATESTVATRTGYTFSGWKNGETAYDFNSAVTSNLTLTASWIAHTYTVTFDKNAEDATGTMDQMPLTYDGDYVTLGNSFSRAGYKFTGWNTEANGSGTPYSSEEWVQNLTAEDNGNVVLYAQWVAAINIATCSATVPDQTMGGYSYIYYKFESANSNAELAATLGITVKDGNKTLTLGTDYEFGNVVYAATGDGMPESVGDECLLEIKGIGAYDGSLWAPFTITVDDDGDKWGDLTWAFHAGTLTISGTGAMQAASNYSGYTWFRVAKYVKTIIIGGGITTIADEAFAGTSQVNYYSNVQTVSLPSTLESIGTNAFAYCTGLTIAIPSGVTISSSAFYQVGCVAASLQDAGDNADIIDLMADAMSADVTLSDRTLYKDGAWNTLCLPFSLTAEQIAASQLAGCTLMALNGTTSNLTDGILTLNFTNATSITAGTPYIIKWDGDGTNNIVAPVFNGVTIYKYSRPVVTNDSKVTFKGSYDAQSFDADDKSILFMGGANTLYYPQNGASIGAFRAYFEIAGGSAVKAFNISFGDETRVFDVRGKMEDGRGDGQIYNIAGQRLNKPQRGINIINGHKVAIK